MTYSSDRIALQSMLDEISAALPGLPDNRLQVTGEGSLPSVYAVTPLATASIGAAGLAAASLLPQASGAVPHVAVDRRLASMWFAWSLRPQGWTPPAPWDPIAGDYRSADGWIRLHTNAPHHRKAALGVLTVAEERAAVTKAVADWPGEALEKAVIDAGGCAALMRSTAQWRASEPGRHVEAEPLIAWEESGRSKPRDRAIDAERPLSGLRVLDMTRVLAGPVSTRFLASLGADVLRIDPPEWDEAGVIPEVMPGKRGTRLDLAQGSDRRIFERLLAGADLLVHGYRNGALEGLGYGAPERKAINDGLMEVSLDAYGWTGPWRQRRGFDSLVQMSCGIAEAGMRLQGKDKPTPLPVQALDHATGYLMAAAALTALAEQRRSGGVMHARLSLARTAALLMRHPGAADGHMETERQDDVDPTVEDTGWGPAHRLRQPLAIEGADLRFATPATTPGSHRAEWAS